MFEKTKGVIAAGNKLTAQAGQNIYEAGGNAVDAAVGACFMSFLSEPTLTSAAGGGFMMVDAPNIQETLIDFFVQSPRTNQMPDPLDFSSIELDFGDAKQEFFVGAGSMAVPGNVKGLLDAHKKYGRIPLHIVLEPAIKASTKGYSISKFQAYCINLLSQIVELASEPNPFLEDGKLKVENDQFVIPEYADFLELLAREGYDEFYQGEIARKIVEECKIKGGFLTMADFEQYEVAFRRPLNINYRDYQILTNPPPSSGGTLMAFALLLLNHHDVEKGDFGSPYHLESLAHLFSLKDLARSKSFDEHIYLKGIAEQFLSKEHMVEYLDMLEIPMNRKGSTTHISCLDEHGLAASVTTTVGEGSGYIIPNTGMMMNNMLGEPDLVPNGFHTWVPNKRISSMMSPTIIKKRGIPLFVLGSGGSSRIRTALMQVISNLVDYHMELDHAIQSPRVHWENDVFYIEGGFDASIVERLNIPEKWNINSWDQRNMFFGGVHSVGNMHGQLIGVGDERRKGVALKSE